MQEQTGNLRLNSIVVNWELKIIRGEAMTIIVELELSSPYDLTAEEIEKDLRMAEDQIGWNYDYTITDVKVT